MALGAAIVAFAVAIAYFLVILALGLLQLPAHHSSLPKSQLLYAQIVAYGPLAYYLIYFVPRLAKTSLHDLGLRKPTGREVRIGVMGGAVSLIVGVLVSALVDFLYPPRSEEGIMLVFESMHGQIEYVTCLAAIVAIGPVVEEFAFRFFLFNALDRYLPTVVAIAVNGVIFGAVHAESPDQLISISIPIAITGSIFAYLYAKTRCIWVSAIAHATYNTVTIAASIVFESHGV